MVWGRKRARKLATSIATVTGVVALCLLGAPAALANTILHVDAVHGHDTGSCRSAPCKTLGYAATQGRAIPDLITIEAAAGNYTEDLLLGSADSGLTIIGAGSGTNPATSTILTGVTGNPTVNATSNGVASSLSLSHLRIVKPTGDSAPALVGQQTDLQLGDATIDAQGTGAGIADTGATISLINSPITLSNPSGASPAVGAGGGSVTAQGSAIKVAGTGAGIVNGGGQVNLVSSPITLQGTTGSNPAIQDGAGRVTLSSSALKVAGSGGGITDSGGTISLTKSPITLENTSGSAPAIAGGGKPVTLVSSMIDVEGTGAGISCGACLITVMNSPITLEATGAGGSAIQNSGQSVTVSGSPIVVQGAGGGIINGGAPVSVTNSPITLENTSGAGVAIQNGGAAVTVAGSAILVKGTGAGILNGGGPVAVTNSPITLDGTSGSGTAIQNGAQPVTVAGSAIVVKGGGNGISNNGAPVALTNSPITLQKTLGTGVAIQNLNGDVTANKSSIIIDGLGSAITSSGARTALSSLSVTMANPSNTSIAMVLGGYGTGLSHVSVGGAWSGGAISDAGSLALADTTITSGASPGGPLVILADGAGTGQDVSVTRSRIVQQSATQAGIMAANANLAVDSSALLGGSGLNFSVTGGASRSLTVASSTIDAGTVGHRDISPVQSLTASADNTSGSRATVNVEGSVLVEPPAATRSGTNGTAVVNCSHTEIPSTTQAATASLGAINCGGGANGNTFTSSLAAIFAHPGSGITLNPSWSGVDSVPASAISLPAPFADSATDLLGHRRALNGHGTCTAGLRDKGAVELTGHGGVVPRPRIVGPTHVSAGVSAAYAGKAPNVPSGVPKSFAWHTSDGGSGHASHFTHTFKHAGKFKLSLRVTGAAGCTALVSERVTAK